MTSFCSQSSFEELFEGRISQELGCPIPLDQHAVSVSLPKWSDVVGYEEGEARVKDQMSMGYPRFKVHSSIETLIEFTREKYAIHDDLGIIILPGTNVAKRFVAFAEQDEGDKGKCNVGQYDDLPEHVKGLLTYTTYPIKDFVSKAKAFWQHIGEIPSSRLVEYVLRFLRKEPPSLIKRYSLDDLTTLVSGADAQERDSNAMKDNIFEDEIKDRILSVLEEPNDHDNCTLTVSGMACIFIALRIALSFHEHKGLPKNIQPSTVVFGFPYLDTLKMNKRPELVKGGCTFLSSGEEDDLDRLEALLDAQAMTSSRVCALFTEVPSNPLLKIPDMQRLNELAKKYDFLLVVDDTISGFAQVDLFSGKHGYRAASATAPIPILGSGATAFTSSIASAPVPATEDGVKIDLLCSSLTKIFSGRGDVLAGSTIVNSSSRHAGLLKTLLLQETAISPTLFAGDAKVLAENSRNYEERCLHIMQMSYRLARWLRERPEIETVWHPCFFKEDALGSIRVHSVLRQRRLNEVQGEPGMGCLLSLLLKGKGEDDRAVRSEAFYDALHCLKGPSLGTPYTLCCPYTLLAHYTETTWAAEQGVPKCLIRVSVGLEDWEVLEARFAIALEAGVRASKV